MRLLGDTCFRQKHFNFARRLNPVQTENPFGAHMQTRSILFAYGHFIAKK